MLGTLAFAYTLLDIPSIPDKIEKWQQWAAGGQVMMPSFVSLPSDWLGWLLLIVGFALLFGNATASFVRNHVLPGTKEGSVLPQAPGPTTAVAPAFSGSLVTQRIPTPGSPNTPQKSFVTEGRRNREIDIGGFPRTLRFLEPTDTTIRENDLPSELPCGNGKLAVVRFFDKGFVLDEINTSGDRVRVDFYLAETRSP